MGEVLDQHPAILALLDPAEIVEASLNADAWRLDEPDDVSEDVRFRSAQRHIGWLAALLASPENKLKRLKICGRCARPFLDAASVALLLAALGRGHAALEEVMFSDDQENELWSLSPTSCAHLARALPKLRLLRALHLVMQVESAPGYDLILQGIAECRHLTSLFLRSYDHPDAEPLMSASVAQLQHVLNRISLQHLALEGHVIPPPLFKQLEWPHSLRTLRLCGVSFYVRRGDDIDVFWHRVAESICRSQVTALSANWGCNLMTVAGFGQFLRILTQSSLVALEMMWL